MSELVKRSITGVFFVTVLVGGIWLHPISFLCLFAFITAGAMCEFYRIINKDRLLTQKYLGVITGVTLFVVNFFYAQAVAGSEWFLILIFLVALMFISELYRGKDRPFDNIASSVLGVVYIAVPFSALNYFVFPNGSGGAGFTPEILLGFFFLMWASDTGAYLAGSKFGRHRLFERISPKKSWEGFAGGVLLSMAVAFILSYCFKMLSLTDWLIISGLVSVFGVYGDLNESMLKRSLNIKDSGTILPGHGGFLDRFDSVLLAAPIVFIYLRLFV